MNKILFIPINSRDSEMFIPLIKKLEGQPGNVCLVISLDEFNKQNSEELLLKNNIHFKRISEYRTKDVQKIVLKEKPNLIVVTNDQSMIERSFVLAGNHLNVPTLFLQNGAIGQISYRKKDYLVRYLYTIRHGWYILVRYMFFFATLNSIEKRLSTTIKKFLIDLWKNATKLELRGQYGCSMIATTGNYEKEIFINYGVPNDKIIPIGNPKFDRIINSSYDSEKIFNQYKIPKNKKIILLTTQAMVEHGLWTEKQREIFAKSIINAFRELSDVQLLIKYHPWEPIDIYKKIMTNAPDNVILCENTNLYELINACEILITLLSTTALEAMIFNKVVIIVNLFDDSSFIPYVESGSAIGVYKIEDLPSAIKKGLYDDEVKKSLEEYRENFIYRHAYKVDGKALDRAIKLIYKMLRPEKNEN